jgi:aromatic-L-amino-acid decarboxylase
MTSAEFKKEAYRMVDLMVEYMDTIESYPVKSQVKPKEVYHQLPNDMPRHGESMDQIISDFREVIMPGITHWQHPNFYAYFQANASPPSILAEMLTATLGVQGMKWDTSPASTELEEKVMSWLSRAIKLPSSWEGVIQSTASDSTLCALLTAREQRSDYAINQQGFKADQTYRVYCSTETHSSGEKAAKIAGIGQQNVVKIGTHDLQAISTEDLLKNIQQDIEAGYTPLCVMATLGTTSTLAMDAIGAIAAITSEHNIWLHIDAAYAGAALILPEYQHLIEGIEIADSFVFNPHKWLFTNFDCSAYFVKDPVALKNTFAILPEYLKTSSDSVVNNHCDWGIPLGRRFRSLKLWFVLRYYGLTGLQEILRGHIEMAAWVEKKVVEHKDFELMTPRSMNLVCFRWHPSAIHDDEQLERFNQSLLQEINQSGELYMTHTRIKEKLTLRMSIGQLKATKEHVQGAWETIVRISNSIAK